MTPPAAAAAAGAFVTAPVDLPLNLAARCVSYNVASIADLAKLRAVNKRFGRALYGQVGRALACPSRNTNDSCFVHRFLSDYDPPGLSDGSGVCVGEIYNVRNHNDNDNDNNDDDSDDDDDDDDDDDSSVFRMFPGARYETLYLVGPPKNFREEQKKESELATGITSNPSPSDNPEASTKQTVFYGDLVYSNNNNDDDDDKNNIIPNEMARLKAIAEARYTLLHRCHSYDEIQKVYQQAAEKQGLFQPIQKQQNKDDDDDDDDENKNTSEENDDAKKAPEIDWDDTYVEVMPTLLTMKIPKTSKRIQKKITLPEPVHGVTEFLVLQSTKETINDENNQIGLMHHDCHYHALVLPKEDGGEGANDDDAEEEKYYNVQLLIKLLAHADSISENIAYDCETLRNIVLEGIVTTCQKQKYVEGVAIVDNAVTKQLRTALLRQIQALADAQEQNGTIDYHPHSNNVVRDLVHPGLYSYVNDVSPLRAQVNDVEPCIFPTSDLTASSQAEGQDFWGRNYETSKYQWLPTYVNVGTDGQCVFEDYINNLVPRDDPVKKPLYDSLGRLLEECLPYMESVYSYVHAIRPELRAHDEDSDYDDCPLKELLTTPLSFRGQKIQVIPKIVDYELRPGQKYEGVWHVEGMSHEEIVLTALYILDRDDDIEGGSIAFKRAFLRDEAMYIFSNIPQCRPSSVEQLIRDGLAPLGEVETLKGRLVVFPNSHVHKVQEMIHNECLSDSEQDDGDDSKRASKRQAKVARRRIVVFFLVNPMRRIVSTREVAPQQGSKGMSHDDALAHRLELMKERKYHKQDWNVREIELCEH